MVSRRALAAVMSGVGVEAEVGRVTGGATLIVVVVTGEVGGIAPRGTAVGEALRLTGLVAEDDASEEVENSWERAGGSVGGATRSLNSPRLHLYGGAVLVFTKYHWPLEKA